MKDTKKRIIVIVPTNNENCASSWGDKKDALIKKMPYYAVLKGVGGGYFESVEEIRKFYSKIQGAEKITGYGNWEVE